MNNIIFTINGIRRSGNHAIANWIAAHYKTVLFVNDSNFSIREKSNHLPCFNNICKKTNLNNKPEIIIIGFENKVNQQINIDSITNRYNKKFNNIYHIIHISLVRNIFNVIASNLKAWPSGSYHEGLSDYWKSHIDSIKNNKTYMLVYDKWLDQNNRDIFAQDLYFENKNLGINQIPAYGGGSSFKDTVVNINNLKNRWKTMLDNERFMNMVKSFKYWQDYVNIFGEDELFLLFNKN